MNMCEIFWQIQTFIVRIIKSEIFWQALTAIGTISATIVALLITKWEHHLNNKKELKIEWLHVFRGEVPGKILERSWNITDKSKENTFFSHIRINLINTGNKIILITGIKLSFEDGTFGGLIGFEGLNFPCKLDREEFTAIYIPAYYFCETIRERIITGQSTLAEKTAIVIVDSSSKEYKLTIKRNFDWYMCYYEKFEHQCKEHYLIQEKQ